MRLLIVLAILLLAPTISRAEQPQPYVYKVISYEVIDGDTIRTRLDLGFDLEVEQLARVHGIDTPESDTAAGQAVTNYVDDWCKAQTQLVVISLRRDKYGGRYLAAVHGDNETLAANLVRLKLARPYAGGKKAKWNPAELRKVATAATEARLQLEEPTESLFTFPSSEDSRQETERIQVWVTDSGDKYHRESCRFCDASGRPVDLSAVAPYMEPCKVCRPPTVDNE